jgi:hypothetical protein
MLRSTAELQARLPNPTAGGGDAVVPAPFLFDGSQSLRISSWNSQVGVVVAIAVRLLNLDGTVTPMTFSHVPTSDRAVKVQDYPIGKGALLTATVYALAGAPLLAQTFVQVSVIQGFQGATVPLATLAQAYVTAAQPVAWPGTPLRQSWEGPGALSLQSSQTSVPGVSQTLTCPTGARWKLGPAMTSLQTSAAIGNRRLRGSVIVGAIVAWDAYAPAVQAPSVTINYAFAPGLPHLDQTAGVGLQQIGVPDDVVLRAGDQFQVWGVNIDAADVFTVIHAKIEEWLDVS